MALRPDARVTVGTTPVELTMTPTDRQAGASIVIKPPAGATLYVGPAGVTATTGFPVEAGTTFSGELQYGERVYGVLASGTGTAHVFQSGI